MAPERLYCQAADPTPPVGFQKLLANSDSIREAVELNDIQITKARARRPQWNRSIGPNIHYKELLSNYYATSEQGSKADAYDTIIAGSVNTILSTDRALDGRGRELVRAAVPVIRAVLESEIADAPKDSDEHVALRDRLNTLNKLQVGQTVTADPRFGLPDGVDPRFELPGQPRTRDTHRGARRRLEQVTGQKTIKKRAS